ncbi:MAG: 16S rRNA (cytidine(1402)-2'-O)-methyltransferase [Pseudolysinimonas sp.]|uniref:16S rRNA (cytidine(1402)-2'-O)-methyltransferase n=1 Tax=Pseudolysinimonas sp. TaxID=2680009 RepID=UPI0032648BB2
MIILGATPIGNLGDASRRLVETLERVSMIAAEDTRVTVHLLRGLGIENRPRLVALHEHNERQKAAELVELARTDDILVLSDAGMPTVSDPGYALVLAAIAAGVTVTALPGPSAVLTALALSGLPTDRFAFEGFLPRKARIAALRPLATEARTLVFFESPHRLADSLKDLATAFGPTRQAAVCRELTKLYEEVARGTLEELAERYKEGTKGEIVIVVDGAPESDATVDLPAAVATVLSLAAGGIRLKEAAGDVANATGLSTNDLYEAALKAKSALKTKSAAE